MGKSYRESLMELNLDPIVSSETLYRCRIQDEYEKTHPISEEEKQRRKDRYRNRLRGLVPDEFLK